jgi:hypothetical protein
MSWAFDRLIRAGDGSTADPSAPFKRGYADWSEGDRDGDDELAHHTLAALDELRTASASLG